MTKTVDEIFKEVGIEKSTPKMSSGTKPPSDGKCKRCGEKKPINRLKLCYKCWVELQLESSGWKSGEPHPDWCQCEGLDAHPGKLN